MEHVGLVARLEKAIISKASSGCWNVSPATKQGYGKIRAFGETKLSHRVSYELFNGPIKKHLMVCHKCDNPSCINPEHLFLGTANDNMQDKISKGRHAGARKGSKHHKAKLTEWQVKEIKSLLKKKVSQRQISEAYKVSQTIISNIKTGKRWSHVK